MDSICSKCAWCTCFALILVFFLLSGASTAQAQSAACPAAPDHVVDIEGDDASWRALLSEAVACPNTRVRLGPNVDMSFDHVKLSYDGNASRNFPLQFARCVTLTSVSAFPADHVTPAQAPDFDCTTPGPVILAVAPPGRDTDGRDPAARTTSASRRLLAGAANLGAIRTHGGLAVEQPREPDEARSPTSLGPILRFGSDHESSDGNVTRFFRIDCEPGTAGPGDAPGKADGVTISGFRLIGPSYGNQTEDNFGIAINRCRDITIRNMEIAGWGGAAIAIDDDEKEDIAKTQRDAGRMTKYDDVRIIGNFLHHNQHPSTDGHAAGYGTDVGAGAWARIEYNVFDYNRHGIAASGHVGGYRAANNLVLNGGGDNGGFFNPNEHMFDVHGTDNCTARSVGWGILGTVVLGAALIALGVAAGPVAIIVGALVVGGLIGSHFLGGSLWNCGYAGFKFDIEFNAFQYDRENAISLRGMPRDIARIQNNAFMQSEMVHVGDYPGSAAIHLNTATHVEVFDSNITGARSFGDYGVCDIDGDGIDDLFLATGVSWWYSSFGEFQWTWLNTQRHPLKDLRVGYFDGDARCDILAQRADGAWVFVSGARGGWQDLGQFGKPLSEVRFGRFDPTDTDSQPGATRRTTHAFWRQSDGQWFVTPLTAVDWQPVASSGFPLKKLQFGDFTGDGVTDVLAVENGHWSISESARGGWRPLNPQIHDAVEKLYVANLDADDNIDDLLKLDSTPSGTTLKLRWMRSRNGTDVWREWRSYSFSVNANQLRQTPIAAFAGRFGEAPGGGTLVTDGKRIGHFFSKTEAAFGRNPEWTAVFPY